MTRLFFAALVWGVVLLQPQPARAGTGTFRDGKFNFCVSVRFNATESQLQRIREVFSVASQILADATDGQHQFGTISIINNSGASDQADFWIHQVGGRAHTSGGYGFRGQHVNLFYGSNFATTDTINDALTVVHEFGHLAYDLGDEYIKGDTGSAEVPAQCPGDDVNSPTLSYCIMDSFVRGSRFLTPNYSVNEFCVDSNHDKPVGGNPTTENDTAQSKKHNNDSCWETMSKIERKWRLLLPSGLPQDAPPATQPVVFNTSCAGQTQRVVLLIDRSGSMTTQNRLGFAKTGAGHFVSLYGAGDYLGIVSFSTMASVDFPLTAMNDAAKNNARFALNALTASGATNMSDGLLLALSQLNSGECSDCQKTIILLSDGDANVGLAPESLIQTLQASDVKVIAATIGTDISVAGERSLKTISNQTGGGYFRAYRLIDFLDFLVRLAFGSDGYRGIVNEPRFIGSNQTIEIPVLVESVAANSNFGISLPDQTGNITLTLRKPSGAVLTESNAPSGQFMSTSGMKLFKIPSPENGTWTMVLTSGVVQSGSIQTFAFTQHDGTDFWASVDNDNIQTSEAFRVHATPTHDGKNVVGAFVTGVVTRPDGSQVAITLFDDGSEAHGDNSANDGIYSALFQSYSRYGTYTFDLKYQNTNGQTYTGEPLPNENGVVESFPSMAVPAAVRITSVTAILSGESDRIWFDDALPEGAIPHADGDVDWYWVDANPGAFSGTKSHQSRNFTQAAMDSSLHQHYFDGATTTLPVNLGDKLFTYVFLDVNNMPRELMLQWKDANGWEHRAYWGANNIAWGTDGTGSRKYMGALPLGGTWVRLEVSASDVALEGATLNGMAFTLDGGRATFDMAGKATANAAPPPTTQPGDFVWFDENLPSGAVTATVNDTWNWVNHLHYTGSTSHMSTFDPSTGVQFRSHSFTGAQTPMQVNPGDVLFTYVYLGDPDTRNDPYTPNQIMLQWYDGTSWEHRAFWGLNYIGQRIPNTGVQGTEGQRYMGGMPAARGWYRLEVPASYVGLEGKLVSGMAFSAYRDQTSPYVAWDRSGKSAALTTLPLTLSSTSGVWRSYSSTYGYAFEMPDVAPTEHQLQKISFYVHPNQAAGTVPMHRFRKNGYEYFYTQCRTCPGTEWQYEGVAFYIYPDGSTPGTVPLYLYRDNHSKYFLTIDQNEAASLGMTLDTPTPWAYVWPNANLLPIRPTGLTINGCNLSWTDNSNNESGFKIEWRAAKTSSWKYPKWVEIATVGANVTSFSVTCPATGYYLVRAYNTTGNSGYSNEIWAGGPKDSDYSAPSNTAPEVNITSPANGDVVDHNFTIYANAFDVDGNGTIAKVEVFANGIKLAEVPDAPYVFVWNNAPAGTYSLTAKATDNAGLTTTSAAVTVTVTDVSTTRINFALAANGAVATAQNYTQDGVYSGYHFYPSYAIDGQRYGHLMPCGCDINGFWRDEHGLASWFQVDFNGSKTIDEVDVFTSADGAAMLTQADPSATQTFTQYGVTAFDVQYWTGSAWQTVPGGSVSGNSLVWKRINFAAVTTSKIRVVVNGAVDNVTRIMEVEAWGSPTTRSNVALASNGATATAQNYTADSTYPGYHWQPSYAIDGQRYCHLLPSGQDGTQFWRDEHGLPSWLEVDFNGSKTIGEIDVYTTKDYPALLAQSDPAATDTFTQFGASAFDVQYWNGGAWQTVSGGSITGNNLVWRKINFAAVTTSKIRVVVNSAVDGVARINEVEAWTP